MNRKYNVVYYLDYIDECVVVALKSKFSGSCWVFIKDIEPMVCAMWDKSIFSRKPMTPRKIGASLRRIGGEPYRTREGYSYKFDNITDLPRVINHGNPAT